MDSDKPGQARTVDEIVVELIADMRPDDRKDFTKALLIVALKSYATEYAEERVREAQMCCWDEKSPCNCHRGNVEKARAEGYKAGEIAMREREARYLVSMGCPSWAEHMRSLSIEEKP